MPLAAVIPAPGADVEVIDYPSPTVEQGGVLLETIYSEVCGTDVHLQHGRLSGVPYPLIPGHVSIGRVANIAGEVKDVDGQPIRVGQVVTFLDVHETCNHCWYCLVAKATTRCPSRKVYGITYGADDGLLGGWCEQIYMRPGVKIIPLPEDLPPKRFIAAGCGLPTSLHAVDRAEIRLGDTVVVQGSGPVGLSVAMLSKLSGAGQVIVLDQNEFRLEAAKSLGIDQTVCGDAELRIQAVLEATHGRGADICIEATGAPPAIAEGFRMTRDGGRYVVVGHYTDAGTIDINPHIDINRKHLDIRGCWGSDFSHFYRGVKLVARHSDQFPGGGWDQLISGAYGLTEMNEALAAVSSGSVIKALVDPSKS